MKALKRIDLVGKKYSMLTVLRLDVEKTERTKRIHWICLCECGNEKSIDAGALTTLHTKSCGCICARVSKGHGHTSNGVVSSEFSIWFGIIERCTNENCKAYPDYGGRGIKVCGRWRNSFNNFIEDMGNRPKGLSLERVNNDGNYEKSNCIWATRKVQARNTRKNIFFEYNGEVKCLAEWAETSSIRYATLYRRLVKMKLPPEKAFTLGLNYRGIN